MFPATNIEIQIDKNAIRQYINQKSKKKLNKLFGL